MYKKENKGKSRDITNTPISNRQNKTFTRSKNKKQNKITKPLTKSSSNRIDSESNKISHQPIQAQIHLKQIIELKNKEINNINEENKKSKIILLEKEKEIMLKESEIDMLNKEVNILKNKNQLLEEEINSKEQQIKELNDSLIEYKQTIKSTEESTNFRKQINELDTDIEKKIENYEIELNKIKNNLN